MVIKVIGKSKDVPGLQPSVALPGTRARNLGEQFKDHLRPPFGLLTAHNTPIGSDRSVIGSDNSLHLSARPEGGLPARL
jgi:hypothetical protein